MARMNSGNGTITYNEAIHGVLHQFSIKSHYSAKLFPLFVYWTILCWNNGKDGALKRLEFELGHQFPSSFHDEMSKMQKCTDGKALRNEAPERYQKLERLKKKKEKQSEKEKLNKHEIQVIFNDNFTLMDIDSMKCEELRHHLKNNNTNLQKGWKKLDFQKALRSWCNQNGVKDPETNFMSARKMMQLVNLDIDEQSQLLTQRNDVIVSENSPEKNSSEKCPGKEDEDEVVKNSTRKNKKTDPPELGGSNLNDSNLPPKSNSKKRKKKRKTEGSVAKKAKIVRKQKTKETQNLKKAGKKLSTK